MVTQAHRRSSGSRNDKKEKVINLTDSGRHNNMRVVRDLQDDGTYRLRQVNWDASLIPEENYQDPDSLEGAEGKQQTGPPTFIAQEDKGSSYPEPYHQPQDIEPGYEEQLETTGTTIIKSETYFPASRITTNKRSMTHDEIADQRGYVTR